MTTIFHNLTPHALNIYDEGRILVKTIPPSGNVVRVEMKKTYAYMLVGIPVYLHEYGPVIDMPDNIIDGNHHIYIVSRMVADALKDVRSLDGVVVPGELIRNEKGVVIGCIGLCAII
jgi:hypothetical protein